MNLLSRSVVIHAPRTFPAWGHFLAASISTSAEERWGKRAKPDVPEPISFEKHIPPWVSADRKNDFEQNDPLNVLKRFEKNRSARSSVFGSTKALKTISGEQAWRE